MSDELTQAELTQDGLIDPDDDDLDTDYDPTKGAWGVSVPGLKNMRAFELQTREAALKAWDTRGRKDGTTTSGTTGRDGTAVQEDKTVGVTRPRPNTAVASEARRYAEARGLEHRDLGYVAVDQPVAGRIADAYDAMPDDDSANPAVVEAYTALAVEVEQQWDNAIASGMTFTPWTKDGQPYETSIEMAEDVRENKHLAFFTGGSPNAALARVDPKSGLTLNDKFRAIHDYYGHAAGGFGFGPRGEENAWQAHSQMFSPTARRAMTTETRGQNSWVNFGRQNYNGDGSPKNIPPAERPFAKQKYALLPDEFVFSTTKKPGYIYDRAPKRQTSMLTNHEPMSYREKLMLLANSEAAVKSWETRRANGWVPKDREEKPRRDRSKAKATKAKRKTVREMRPATAAELAKLKGIVPPAGTNVMVPVEKNTGLIATWEDEKGRTQPRFDAAHRAKSDAEKFARVKEFNDALPDLRKDIAADMKSGDEAASVLYLIDKTGFRPGSTKNTKAEKQAYGASTLLAEHVKVSGNRVDFKFTGKSGVMIEKSVEDATLARMIGRRVKATNGGRLFNTSDDHMNDYLKEKAGGGFKTKDFRTWHGTAQALRAMKGLPKPKNDAEFKRSQREVSKVVAAFLGNTPTVAKKSYIDPAVWGVWESKTKK